MDAAQVAWALAAVLALLGALRLVARFAGLDAGNVRSRSLRVLESCSLGAKRSMLLVEAGGERLLLASSESGVALLRVLPGEEALATDAPAEGSTASSSALSQPSRSSIEKPDQPPSEEPAMPASTASEKWQRKRLGFGKRIVLPALLLAGTAVLTLLLPDSAAAEAKVSADSLVLSLEGAEGAGGLSSSIELLILMTLISVAPSLLLMTTCFTRIVIVLAFVRQALGVQNLPPNQVLVGLALFLTMFVMAPLGESIKSEAYDPYSAGEIGTGEAIERGMVPIRRYLMAYAKENDVALFEELAHADSPPDEAHEGPEIQVLLPAFLLSELRTAFEIGFTIFLPFLVIDLVVASMLISMGMIVLPPIVVSLPFKLMLFVLVDGWNLVLSALVNGLR